MKKLPVTLAALAVMASGAMAQDVVRIGTEGAYPPWNFINEANEVVGFEIDLGNEICARADLTCEWVLNDWDTIIPNLVSGNYDVIMAGMSITEARSQVISFTTNYLPSDPSAYMALDGTDVSVIDSGVIAVQSNTVQAGLVADSTADALEFPTPDETISAVRNGEADAVLADKNFLQAYVDDSAGELAFIGDDFYPGEGTGAGIRQSDNELRETFTRVIDEMKEDGSLNDLIETWFGDGIAKF